MAKRVLLVAQNFYPEFFKSNDIASDLVARGYKVDVLAGIPNYPEGVFYKGYGIFRRRVDDYNGAKVYRVYQIPRGRKPGAMRLSLNYLSFAFCSTFWVLFFLIFKRRYDAIVVHQTSPITQAWPALLLGRLRRTPIYTWVLDIWPDSVMAFMSKPRKIISAPLNWFTNRVYRRSRRILISSPMFRELVNRDHNYDDKIVYYPNWCEDIISMEDREVPKLDDGFRIMMAGNLSDATGLEGVVEVIKRTKVNSSIKWTFVGGGNREAWLRETIQREGLTDCCSVLGRYPFECMASLYKQADIMFISLKPTTYNHLNATIPARLQSYIAAGKPIVGMIGEGVTKLVDEINCGRCVEAGDVEGCAKLILQLADNTAQLKAWGENARRYYVEHYTRERCIDNLVDITLKGGSIN
jgi:glycosyltransferase involved in cell wall biosynthesis